jgi:hypothetical protein
MSDYWSWNHNMADVFELYDRGWSEGFEAVKAGMENAARVAMAAMEETQTLERHVSGSFVDVPAYLRGEPESMYEFEQRIVDVLKVTVELDGFIVCTTDADEIMYRGVAVMSAIMALRRLGIFVDLVHVMKGSASTYDYRKGGKGGRAVSATTHSDELGHHRELVRDPALHLSSGILPDGLLPCDLRCLGLHGDRHLLAEL